GRFGRITWSVRIGGLDHIRRTGNRPFDFSDGRVPAENQRRIAAERVRPTEGELEEIRGRIHHGDGWQVGQFGKPAAAQTNPESRSRKEVRKICVFGLVAAITLVRRPDILAWRGHEGNVE